MDLRPGENVVHHFWAIAAAWEMIDCPSRQSRQSRQSGQIMVRQICQSLFIVALFSTLARAQTAPPAPPPATLPSAAAHYTLKPGIPTLWIVGASAVRNGHDTGNDGQWGWGNPICSFFDRSRINVIDFALGGTSTRTYQSFGLWDHVLGDMKSGDYLLIQFGSNDSSPVNDTARARGTLHGNGEETQEIDNLLTKKHEVVHTFGWYVRKFITDAKAKGAVCEIVLSPDPKNSWKDGKTERSTNFTDWDTAAAKQENVPFVDANELIAEKYDAAGQDAVTKEYFPEGETEHTDWAGAILNARRIVEGIKGIDQCDLRNYLLANLPAELPLPSGKAR
jgi:lysophospholipase L1-like esterase